MRVLAIAAGAALCFSLTARGVESESYPRGDLLVEPGRLAEESARREFVILDVRPREEYVLEHIPSARWVDAAAWAKALGDGKDQQAWSTRIGELGIAPDSKVVVYDDKAGRDAARVWWLLRYWGVADVRLLNGGWKGWRASGLPVSGDDPAVARADFYAAAAAERLMTLEEVRDVLDSDQTQLVDARSEAEYCGIDKQSNKAGGAIPGAKHLEWSDLVDAETHRFKSPDELRKLFAAAKIDLARPAVSYCQSGGRASVMAFALELMGAKDVRNYFHGWSQWGNQEGLPVMLPNEEKHEAADNQEE